MLRVLATMVALLTLPAIGGVVALDESCSQFESESSLVPDATFTFDIDEACQGAPFRLVGTGAANVHVVVGSTEDWDICFRLATGGTECFEQPGNEIGNSIPADAVSADVYYFLGVGGGFEFTAWYEAPAGGDDGAVTTRADFANDQYYQEDWFEWTTTEIDVIVNLAATEDPVGRAATLKASIEAWEAGIQHYGADWLRNGIDIRSWVVGFDVIPEAVLADPEVVITSAEPGVLGVAIHPGQVNCATFADDESTHQHDDADWLVGQAVDCVDGEPLHYCMIVNTNWRLHQIGMYDLNSHEFGHCLGLGHVGDAGDFTTPIFPNRDIMSYKDRPNHVMCVSESNVRGIELAFADILGQPTPAHTVVQKTGARYIERAPADYEQVDCDNAPDGFLF